MIEGCIVYLTFLYAKKDFESLKFKKKKYIGVILVKLPEGLVESYCGGDGSIRSRVQLLIRCGYCRIIFEKQRILVKSLIRETSEV